MRSLAYVIAAAVALFYPGATALAQESAPPAHVLIQTGLFDFELDGDGYAPMLAARAVVPVATVLMLEGSVLAARPGQDFATTTLLIPEAQVQLVLPFVRLVPYIGLGAGAAIDFRDSDAGGRRSFATFSGAVGAKYWLRETFGAQLEYRARGIGSDGASSNEFGLALLWQL